MAFNPKMDWLTFDLFFGFLGFVLVLVGYLLEFTGLSQEQ
jgi:hypothetical protein